MSAGIESVPSVPEGIVTAEARLIYLYLQAADEPTVDEMASHTGAGGAVTGGGHPSALRPQVRRFGRPTGTPFSPAPSDRYAPEAQAGPGGPWSAPTYLE